MSPVQPAKVAHSLASYLLSLLVLSFIGFSILLWAFFEAFYGLAGFGLAMILIPTLAARHALKKQLSLAGLLGAIAGATISLPIGYLIGQYLRVWIGFLAAAIWGGIIGPVLLMAIGNYLLRFMPLRIRNILYGTAVIAGMYLGAVRMGSNMDNLYGPVGGTVLLGWISGMALGLMVGYQLIPDKDTVSIDT